MHKEKIIDHIANAMIIYDAGSGQKTWKELATVAYYTNLHCLYNEDINHMPDILIGNYNER